MAVIGREGVDPAAVGVDRDSEVLTVLDPEITVEPAFQVGGFLLEPVRKGRILPDQPCQPGASHLGVIRVALELASRTREARQVAVPVRNRIP